MFLISIELIVLKINNPITHLNGPEDYSESYSSTGIGNTNSLLNVGRSCLSVSELIFVHFSATVADLTVSSALNFEGLGISSFHFLGIL